MDCHSKEMMSMTESQTKGPMPPHFVHRPRLKAKHVLTAWQSVAEIYNHTVI